MTTLRRIRDGLVPDFIRRIDGIRDEWVYGLWIVGAMAVIGYLVWR